jgi:hypothetical protein
MEVFGSCSRFPVRTYGAPTALKSRREASEIIQRRHAGIASNRPDASLMACPTESPDQWKKR